MLDFLDALGISELMREVKVYFQPPKKEVVQDTSYMTKKFQFRPRTFDEYIGQENAKELIKLNLNICKTTKNVHFLLSGNAGTGKTSLAQIIANELGQELNSYVGSVFAVDNFVEFMAKNQDSSTGQILLVDEVHGLGKETMEFMLPVIEDFNFRNLRIKPFIMICATTEKSTMLKKCRPFVDRIGAQIQLSDYTVEDMIAIAKQYNGQLYQANVTDDCYRLLAENVRFTPRILLSYMDLLVSCGDVKKVLAVNRVIKDSLTDTDIKILKHLSSIDKPVGEQALAIVANIEREDYKDLYEPFILRQEYITRTARGRIITEKGRQLLSSLT